jgi:hypothetical protein
VECGVQKELLLTESDFERGVSPLVNGALSLLMSPLFFEKLVSSVACGVMSEGCYKYAVSGVCFCGKARISVEGSAVEEQSVWVNVKRDTVSTYLIICEHVPGIAR